MQAIKPLLPLSCGDPRTLIIRHADVTSIRPHFLASLGQDQPIGVAIHLHKGRVDTLAFASNTHVLVVKTNQGTSSGHIGELKALRAFMVKEGVVLGAFEMATVSLHIWRDLKCHSRGWDLSTARAASSLTSLRPSELYLRVFSPAQSPGVSLNLLFDSDNGADLCHRAWISHIFAERCRSYFTGLNKIDTRRVPDPQLDCLAKMVLQMHQLEAAKPKTQKNDFSKVVLTNSNRLTVHNSRYKSRVRISQQTSIVMQTANGDVITGKAVKVIGKQTTVSVSKGSSRHGITGVTIVGKEDLTNAERARNEYILLVLCGQRDIRASVLGCLFFVPTPKEKRSLKRQNVKPVAVDQSWEFERLNASQTKAAHALCAGVKPVVVVQGPPGTGKTSTISAAVKAMVAMDRKATVWIVAQSNVGVKNIAESLAKKEVDFKLLVSQEFYVEWHEHIYAKVEKVLIRTDELPDGLVALERLISPSRVILCTLSTLSNPRLQLLFDLVPVNRLIVDEASQINIYEYMHIFAKFSELQQVALFGDNKQLPPYGIDTAPTIQSVFEVEYFKKCVYFLDIQYRMPMPIGNFISKAVYGSRLKSQHEIDNPSCVAFVNVANGCETQVGTSWTNQKEVQVIAHIVKRYYRHSVFCIITPYDAQRAAIEKELKAQKLPWDRVFNVDSFQGNESPIVMVSVVRTTRPGFLRSQERVNVMLTRCKAGMIIVSNETFLTKTGAKKTLVGKLAAHWGTLKPGPKGGIWKRWQDVVEGRVDMPAAAAPAHR